MSAAIHTPDAVPITVKRIVYSLYSLLFLCVNMFLWILPATFLYFHLGQTTEKKRLRLHRFICWASDFVIHRVPGTTFTRVNPTSETFEKPALILSNHQSHLDLMCLLSLTPKLVVLTNDWVHRNPIYGLLIRYAEFYTVSDGLETNLERLADLVRRGYSIVVFPEGTRSPDCRIQRFHRGAFYLAEKLQLDLLPVFLHGIGHVLPKNDFMLREGALYTEIGARIPCHDPRYGVDFKTRTSNLRKYYITHYAEICAEREGADYYAWYVYQKYRAQGRKIGRACRRTLQKQGNFRTVIDQAPARALHTHRSQFNGRIRPALCPGPPSNRGVCPGTRSETSGDRQPGSHPTHEPAPVGRRPWNSATGHSLPPQGGWHTDTPSPT